MKKICLTLVLGLFFGPLYSQSVLADTIQEITATTQSFLKGIYLGDKKALLASSVDMKGRESLMLQESISSEEKKDLAKRIKGLRLVPPISVMQDGKQFSSADQEKFLSGARTVLVLDFSGNPMVVPLVKEDDGWKVDIRFLLAAKNGIAFNSPEGFAKRFFIALFQKDDKSLNKLVLPVGGYSVTKMLKANNFPPGDRGHIVALAMEMPVAAARPGEVFLLPDGKKYTAGSQAEETAVVGVFGTVEVPFVLKKEGDAWKVLAQPYIEALQAGGYI